MKYGERLLLWESNFGRDMGWEVELEGKPIARLVRPRDVDMFWVSYEVVLLTDEPFIANGFLEFSFWIENGSRLVFRNHGFKEIAAVGVAAGRVDAQSRRMAFRGLCADIKVPGVGDRFLLMLRGRWRGVRGRSV